MTLNEKLLNKETEEPDDTAYFSNKVIRLTVAARLQDLPE